MLAYVGAQLKVAGRVAPIISTICTPYVHRYFGGFTYVVGTAIVHLSCRQGWHLITSLGGHLTLGTSAHTQKCYMSGLAQPAHNRDTLFSRGNSLTPLLTSELAKIPVSSMAWRMHSVFDLLQRKRYWSMLYAALLLHRIVL